VILDDRLTGSTEIACNVKKYWQPVSSHLENQFVNLWLYYYPSIDLHAEYRFHPTRKFRLDFAHLDSKIGIELNGQIWKKGGHSSGKGLQRDYEKLNLLSSMGWRLFCLSSEMITIENINLIAETIKNELSV
jgi:hypothetical protein